MCVRLWLGVDDGDAFTLLGPQLMSDEPINPMLLFPAIHCISQYHFPKEMVIML